MLIFADGRPPLALARLVGELFGLLHQGKGDGQGHLACTRLNTVERGQEVDAFNRAVRAVVIVPANQFAFISVRLMDDAIVNYQNRLFGLHRSHERLDDLPQVARSESSLGQEASDLVVAQVRLQQAGQACCRCGAKGTD